MTAQITDKITKTFNSVNPNVARVTSNRAGGVTTLACDNLAGWPDDSDTKVHFSTYTVDSGNAVVPGTQIDWAGIVTGNNIGSLTRLAGAADDGNAINDIVEMNPTASWANDLAEHILTQHKQTGAHSDVTADSIHVTGDVIIDGDLTIAGSGSDGYEPISGAISAVAYNGNRSYSLTTSADNTALISPGMRLRTTRTVSAPVQCADLETSSSQYFSKSSPNKLTFTDDFVISAWVKLESYPAAFMAIASRYNGTSGFSFDINSSGQVRLIGLNGGAGNNSGITSYQSLPLGKWVHVTAQLDMSTFTATPTTSYIMLDGIDIPASVARAGTNPTALIQAGDLQIGAQNGSLFFDGKIAQLAIYNAKVTQANIRATISQGVVGNETSLASAYSLSNSITDLNTTTPNNLTASGGALATSADSPFGGQAGGAVSALLDYLIVQTVSAGSIVAQTAEGCTVPTTGGVAAVVYSGLGKPFGFPAEKGKWSIGTLYVFTSAAATTQASPVTNTWYNVALIKLDAPVGSWNMKYSAFIFSNTAGAAANSVHSTLSTSSSAEADKRLSAAVSANAIVNAGSTVLRENDYSLSASTPFYLLLKTHDAAISGVGYANESCVVTAENAYL